jgi:Fe2+ or Zn2+ uptake regulation protein
MNLSYEVAPTHPELSRSTVYNTLNILYELGVITQIDLGDEHTHYETNLQPHVNLICRRCHRVIDYAPSLPFGGLLDGVRLAAKFQPATVHVQVLGLCAACQP